MNNYVISNFALKAFKFTTLNSNLSKSNANVSIFIII